MEKKGKKTRNPDKIDYNYVLRIKNALRYPGLRNYRDRSKNKWLTVTFADMPR